MARTLRSTPAQPVFYGQIHFGYFRTPFPTLNLLAADTAGHRWAPRWWRQRELLRWHRIVVVHPAWRVELGIAQHGTRFRAWCSCDPVEDGPRSHEARMAGLPGAAALPDQLLRGDAFFRQPDFRVQIAHRLQDGRHAVTVHAPGWDVALDVNEGGVQPLIAVLPVNDYRRPLYLHQAPGAVRGTVQIGAQCWALDENAWAWVDVWRGFAAEWERFVLAGQDATSAPVGVHLLRTAIRDDEAWNGCGGWSGGQLSLLGAARFDDDRISTADGRVAFSMARSGHWDGVWEDDAGLRHHIAGARGWFERFRAEGLRFG